MRYTVEFAVKQLACGSWFLLSFEHFVVISTVDKSTDHGKLLSISEFYSNATLKVLTSLEISISISQLNRSFLQGGELWCWLGGEEII